MDGLRFDKSNESHCLRPETLIFILMWELYFDKPSKYLQMIRIPMGKSSRMPRWVGKLEPEQSTQPEDKPWNNTFSRLTGVCQFLDSLKLHGSDVQDVKQFCKDIDEKKEQDILFRFYCKSKLSRISLCSTNRSSSSRRKELVQPIQCS